MSKKFNRTQQNYSAQEREMLALVQAMEHWRHIVEGAKITIRTDHESLKHFRSQKVMSRRLARFIDIVEHFNPTINYRPGKNQQAADSLSRIPGFPSETITENDEIEDNLVMEEEMHDEGHDRTERFFDALTTYLGEGNIDDQELESKIAKEAIHYELRHERLWRYIGDGKRLPVVYKLKDVSDVLESLHKDLGHYGTTITTDAAKKRYYIPNLAAQVKDTIDSCVPCQLYLAKDPKSGPLHEMEAQPAFHTWGMDFVGPLPETRKGNQYLLNAIDFGTSMVMSVPLKARSWETAISLVEQMKYTFGKPARILTDNGSEFLSDKFEVYLKRNSI